MSCDQLEIVSTRPRFPAAFPGCVDTISSWSQDINPPRVTGHQSAESHRTSIRRASQDINPPRSFWLCAAKQSLGIFLSAENPCRLARACPVPSRPTIWGSLSLRGLSAGCSPLRHEVELLLFQSSTHFLSSLSTAYMIHPLVDFRVSLPPWSASTSP